MADKKITYAVTESSDDDSVEEVLIDPLLDPLGDAGDKSSILDQLRVEISKKVERPIIEIPVPEREGVVVKYSPNITQNQLKAWRRNSGETSKDGFDSIRFACYVVGTCCRGFLINEKEVMAPNGQPYTFASDEILEMTGDTRPIPDGIRNFFGIDPHLEATALKIMDFAGYGDDVEEAVNPTSLS